MTTKKKPEKAQARTVEADVVSHVPAHLIEGGRRQSTQIIEALTKTALTLSNSDGAGEKVAIIERLWAMQKDAEDRQAEREFGIAKVAVAMELPTIPKNHMIKYVDKNNTQRETLYADRSDIELVLDPICRRHGFSKEYSTETIDGKACQVLTVRHVAGHKEVYRSPYMPVDSTGNKNNNQAAGSTAEYGKRYALVGAFNIIGVDKDDDGSSGSDKSAGDKFTDRVSGDKGPVKLTLPEAAAAVEAKLRAAEPKLRGDILMRNIKILAAMEETGSTDELKAKAIELRGLCEVVDQGQEGDKDDGENNGN